MAELVGYKLTRKSDGEIIETWGGIWGQCPGIPNPIHLPSGLAQVHAPSPSGEYTDYDSEVYILEPWMMDDPGTAP